MRIMVTGAAGFIGAAVAGRLLQEGHQVEGVDSLDPYYDPRLKQDRLALLTPHPGFRFHLLNLSRREETAALFSRLTPERVIHLAAQAGVRYSITHPQAYFDSNLTAFGNVLEGCRQAGAGHLVYASTSSVYGGNRKLPYAVEDGTDHPLSLYAATKKANELLAHTYSHLFGLPVTGLRFFTVYGPWGRPDMAYFSFTRAILAGEAIPVFNRGKMRRDFTFIDDIVEGVVRVAGRPPRARPELAACERPLSPAESPSPFALYNIGNSEAVELLRFISILEGLLGRKARMELLPLQPGDVPETCADVSALERDVGFAPHTPLEEGLRRFVEWYRGYYQVDPGPPTTRR